MSIIKSVNIPNISVISVESSFLQLEIKKRSLDNFLD